MTLLLSRLKPFAQGGNRLCFVHPDNPLRCIKVRRPDFTLEDRRRKKGFPKNLRPLSSFDDNMEEYKVMDMLLRCYGETVFEQVSRCHGFVDTDMGKGLVSELIRNGNGRISQTLKKYIWDYGLTPEIKYATEQLGDFWRKWKIPSRDLLLHNIVVQSDDSRISRLVVIDGLGSQGILPLRWLPEGVQARKVERKIHNLWKRIDLLLEQRGGQTFPGYHGELLHEGLPGEDR